MSRCSSSRAGRERESRVQWCRQRKRESSSAGGRRQEEAAGSSACRHKDMREVGGKVCVGKNNAGRQWREPCVWQE